MSSLVKSLTPASLRPASEAWSSLSVAQRLLIRSFVSILALVVIALIYADPAHAAVMMPMGPVDDITVTGREDDPNRYLISHRWSPVSFAPSGFLGFGAVAASAPFTIQAMLVTFTVFVVRLFMLLIGLSAGGDLVESSAHSVDRVFANIGNGLLGGADGALLTSGGVAVIVFMLIGLFALSAWRLVKHGIRGAAQTGAYGILALVALIIVSSAAASNESQRANAPTPGSHNSAVASPSWFITKGSEASAVIGNLTQGITNALTDIVDSTPTSGGMPRKDECERYIDAIHQEYRNVTGNATSAEMMIAFDRLMVAVLWDNVRISSMGGATNSSNASWCRFSEMDADVPMIEQVQISRMAGLYSDIVGYNSSIHIEGSSAENRDGSVVTASGNWVDRELGSKIFGPTFVSGDHSTRATIFWAACQWPDAGRGVSLNDAWSKVDVSTANNDSYVQQGLDLFNPFSGNFLGMGDAGAEGKLGSDENDFCGNVVRWGIADDEKWGSRAFQYSESYFFVGSMTGWNTAGGGFFADAVAEGDVEAYEYYRATQGMNPSETVLGGFAAVLAAIVLLRFAAPVAVGLLAAQLVGIVTWMLLPILLLFMIVPLEKTKEFAKIGGKTLIFASFAAVIFQFVLQIALFAYTLIYGILVSQANGSLSRWALTILSAIVAFALVRWLLKSIFTNDITTMRGALKASTSIASRPVLAHRGMAEPDMGFKRPNWLSRASSQAGGMMMHEGRRRVGEKIGGSSAEDILKKKTAPGTEGSKQGAGVATATAIRAGDSALAAKERKKEQWGKVAGATATASKFGPSMLPAMDKNAAQVWGKYSTDDKGRVTIGPDSTIAAAGMFPSEKDIARNAIDRKAFEKLSPRDRAAYTYDPATGKFIPKLNITGMGEVPGLTGNVVAPVSALMDKKAPEGVKQEDWDKTAQMRAEIAKKGLLSADLSSPERKSLFEAVAASAREMAAATGNPLPEAPKKETLAQQAPGLTSAPQQQSQQGDSKKNTRDSSTSTSRDPSAPQQVVVAGVVAPSSLSDAQQQFVAHQAAELLLRDPSRFAESSRRSSSELEDGARRVLGSETDSTFNDQFIKFVQRHAQERDAQRLNMLKEAAVENSGGFGTVDASIERAISEVRALSESHKDERTAAIHERMMREVQSIRANTENANRSLAEELNNQLRQLSEMESSGDDAGSAEVQAAMSRLRAEVAAKQMELRQNYAAEMGRVIDHTGIELNNARVPQEQLEGLRESRASMMSNMERLAKIRGWFGKS